MMNIPQSLQNTQVIYNEISVVDQLTGICWVGYCKEGKDINKEYK